MIGAVQHCFDLFSVRSVSCLHRRC
jgi:hypothetical protein